MSEEKFPHEVHEVDPNAGEDNPENIKQDSKDRGHPHGFVDVDKLKEIIGDVDKQLDRLDKQIENKEKMYELMIKYPKPLNPSFEYENQEEWLEVVRAVHKHNREAELLNFETDRASLQDRKRLIQEQIDTANDEKAHRKMVLKGIKERLEKEDEEDGNGTEE
jgi:Skp family chaperone for outer membrane proteins